MAIFRSLLVVFVLIMICVEGSTQSIVTSDFSSNADGWTAPNALSGTLTYTSTGGNPNGFISAQTPGSVVLGSTTLWIPYYFVAPSKFLSNKSAYYGGGISFDASETTTGTAFQYNATAVMTNAAGQAIYYYPSTPFAPPSFGSWTTFEIPLSAASGEWKTSDASTGAVASAALIQSMLNNINSLQIQGLYKNANVVTRLDNINMYPPLTVATQPGSTSACVGATATFTAVGGSNPTLSYQWQYFTAVAGWLNVSNGTTYSNVTTSTLSVNTAGSGLASTMTYRCRISGIGGVDDVFTNSVTLTINPLPAAPTTTGAARCGAGSVTLNAAGGTAGQYRWYDATGTLIAGQTSSAYITPSLSTTTTYSVSINNGTCESATTAVTATINTVPAAPTTTGAARCGAGSVTLNAAGGTAGQYRWYDATGTLIAGQTSSAYITPSLSTTTTYSVSINNGTCESATTAVTATINTVPAAPTTTDAVRCGAGSVTLNAAGGTAGQYRWYDATGALIAGQTSSAYITPSLSTTTTYSVSINNGTCEGATTAVTATISTVPAAPTTTGGQGCNPSTVLLTAAGGSAGQYVWYTVSSGGTAIAGQANATYTTPSLTTTTTYYVSINNGTCESTRTAVTATINNPPTAPTTTGGQGCNPSTVLLTAAGGTNGQYVWYTVSSGGTAIAGQNNATYTTPSLTTTTTYYVSINNGTCESARTAVTATINNPPTAPTTTGGQGCNPSTVLLTAAGGSAGQYVWYTVSSGGTAIAGQNNSTYTTPSLTATTTYYVSINNGTCESARTAVTATINNPPTAPTTTGGQGCSPSTVLLTAAGGSAGQYRWYTVSSGGTAIAGQTNATYTTPSLTATTTYYVSINNGTCESTRTAVTATINNPPTAPTTTGGQGCNPSTVLLTAAGGSAGQYVWYTVSSGGTAIAGQNNSTYTTPSLTTTTTYYVSINNGTCESTRTAVTATINNPPAAPTTTGGQGCNPSTVLLTAAGGSAGQYVWYTVSSGGTAIAGQANATYTTPSLTTTTTYYVSINNGTCESTRTAVTATINNPPTAPTTTGGQGCNPSTVLLTAAGGSAGQYVWYTVSSGGTAIAGQNNSTYTTPSLTTTTTYYVSINNGTCESTRTAVTATINNPPAAPTTTGGQGCNPSTVLLTAAGGSAGQYVWYTVSSGGTAIAGQNNSTYTTPSLTATTTYYVSINNGTCESTRTAVTATINNPPAAPTTTGGQGCNPSTVLLTAAGGSAGQYRWYTVSSGGTAIAGQTNATYTTPSLTTTTTYYVSINNGTCESTRTAVTATINNPPAAPTTTGGQGCNPSTVLLTAAGGSAGQYVWYTVSSGGTAIAGQTNSTYTTPSLTTTTTYYVSINNGTCESTRTAVTATINNPPAAPTTTGGQGCNPSTVLLTAAGGSAGQYVWYTVSSGGTAIAGQTNATYTTPSLTATTTYYVSINNGTCESTRTAVTATINNPPTAPTTTGGQGCSPSTVLLTAAGGSAGQYVWYTVSSGGTAIAGQANATYTTPSLTTTTNYYVSIDNGICESPRTLVVATINDLPAPPTTTGSSACSPGSVVLTAAGGTNGQYRWYIFSSGGTAITGETNSSYNTPSLSTTTTYYVAIDNGCESPRTSVVATVNTPPSAPTTTGDFSCVAASITLKASGGSAGQYRWYASAMGGTAINNAVDSNFATPVISSTTTYYVSINDGTCESPRTVVTATIGGAACASNRPPAIETTEASTEVGGKITINLADLVSDSDNNLVLSTLTIVSPPSSGASATIDRDFNLVIDYAGRSFSGTESISISVCDSFSACTEQTLSIDVIGSINVYNAVSPNKDGKNDLFIIDGIDKLQDTKVNHVAIFNRWGDLVWEGNNYDNTSIVFSGYSKNNVELPSGTYFYKIEFPGGKKAETGYLTLKR